MDEDLKDRRSAAKDDNPQADGGEQAVSELREGLDHLDAAFHVPMPSSAWFDQQIAATQSKRRTKLMRDLVILWIVAILMFYVFYLTVAAQPVAFLSIQAAAILVPLAWLILRKQVDSHDNN